MGALRALGLDRGRDRRLLWILAFRTGGTLLVQAHRLHRDRHRRAYLDLGGLRRRSDLGKAEVAIIAMALSGLSALLTAADLRRTGLDHSRHRDHLGHDGHPRFRAVLGPGRGRLTRRAGGQPDDAPDRLGLCAHLRDRPDHADAGRLAGLADRAGWSRPRAGTFGIAAMLRLRAMSP